MEMYCEHPNIIFNQHKIFFPVMLTSTTGLRHMRVHTNGSLRKDEVGRGELYVGTTMDLGKDLEGL